MQALAHLADALAHRVELGDPGGVERRLGQHPRDDARAVRRRAGVVLANRHLQLAGHQRGLGRVRADHAQAADAFAVEREALREAVGDEEGQARVGQHAQREGILAHAVAEALVGDVDEGDQAALDHHRDQLGPLRRAQVHAGRVVAAGVQQHHRARGQRADGLQHRVEAQAAGGRVVVRVGVHREARALEDRAVVVPGRVADPDLRGREVLAQEVRADLQRARAAQRLDRHRAPAGHRLMVGAEEQVLDLRAVLGQAGHRQVAARPDRLQQRRLGLAHRLHHRQPAGVVEVDADRQVDATRARVLLEVLVEREDRIARVGVDVFEHGRWLLPERRGREVGKPDYGAAPIRKIRAREACNPAHPPRQRRGTTPY